MSHSWCSDVWCLKNVTCCLPSYDYILFKVKTCFPVWKLDRAITCRQWWDFTWQSHGSLGIDICAWIPLDAYSCGLSFCLNSPYPLVPLPLSPLPGGFREKYFACQLWRDPVHWLIGARPGWAGQFEAENVLLWCDCFLFVCLSCCGVPNNVKAVSFSIYGEL